MSSSSQPPKRASESSGNAPAAKVARTENAREVPHRVMEFVAELLWRAARSGNFGAEVSDEQCETWKDECVKVLTKRYALQDRLSLSAFLQASFSDFDSEAGTTIKTICDLATANLATMEDFAYVLGDRSLDGDATTWASTAERMVHVCVLWRSGDHVAGNRVDLRVIEFVRQDKFILVAFVTRLQLSFTAMPTTRVKSADDFVEEVVYGQRKYHGLCFAATASGAQWLVLRTPAPQITRDAMSAERKDNALTRYVKGQNVLGAAPEVVVPVRLQLATGALAISIIAVSGEAGTGKTLSSIAAACSRGVTFYALAHELSLAALEAQLSGLADPRTHAKHATTHLIELMRSATFDWNPRLATNSLVCLVIDEVGLYPLCARAICKIGDGNECLASLSEHFKCGAMQLFVVGTGVDHAFTHVGSMPHSQVHVRSHEFTDLQTLYVDKSDLWRTIAQHVAPEDLKSGVYAKLLRLSQNIRFAAIFMLLSTADVGLMMRTATCRGARQSFLRNYAAYVLWGALRSIKEYNGLSEFDEIRATTQFGAAFAVACSNEEQGSNDVVTRLVAHYGLLRAVGNEQLTHRFAMSPAVVELGLSGFGMAPPCDGWSGLEAMMADLLYLHAHGAACAGLLGVELTSVRSTKAAINADPLAHIKDWLREHGRGARRVLQTTLGKQVTTCSDAAATLELQAAGQLGASDAMAPCIVIARNGDKAPFADLVIGVVDVVAGGFKTTHMMLLQLKFYRTATLTAYQAWLELFKMGCRKRSSMIAGCVAKLHGTPWPVALSRLTVDASLMAAHPGPFKDGNAAQEALFSALCSDPAIDAVRSPYLEALDRWQNNVDRSAGPTVAYFLSKVKSVVTPSLNVIRDKIGELAACYAEVIHASFGKGLAVGDQYDSIVSDAAAPAANDDGPNIERFIVLYQPHALNDGEMHVAKKKRAREASSPGAISEVQLLIAMPTDCLTIESGSSAAAFYPTGWGNDVYTERTSVHEACKNEICR